MVVDISFRINMPSCSIRGCGNYHGKPNREKVSYYRFPKEQQYCLQWYMACARFNLNLKSATICSRHFEPTAMATSMKQKLMNYSPKGGSRLLKPEALPTMNLPVPNENFPSFEISKQELQNIMTWCESGSSQKKISSSNSPAPIDVDILKNSKSKKRHRVVKEILALIPSDSQNGETKKIILLTQSPSTVRNLPQVKIESHDHDGQSMEKKILIVPSTKPGTVAESVSTDDVSCLLQFSDQQPQVNNSKPQFPANQFYVLNNAVTNENPERMSKIIVNPQVGTKLSVNQILSKHPLILPKTMKSSFQPVKCHTSNKLSTLIRQNAVSVQSDSSLSHSSVERSIDDCDTSGMVMLKEEFKEMKRTIDMLKEEIKSWQVQCNNLKEEKETAESKYNRVVTNTKKVVDNAVQSLLSGIFTPGQIKLLLSTGKSRINWTVKDMRMALALRSISPRAYKYLRNHLKYPLPAPSSVRRFKLLYPLKRSAKTEISQENISELTMLSNPEAEITLTTEESSVLEVKVESSDT